MALFESAIRYFRHRLSGEWARDICSGYWCVRRRDAIRISVIVQLEFQIARSFPTRGVDWQRQCAADGDCDGERYQQTDNSFFHGLFPFIIWILGGTNCVFPAHAEVPFDFWLYKICIKYNKNAFGLRVTRVVSKCMAYFDLLRQKTTRKMHFKN